MVAGEPGKDATFWVSYGPVNGRFGVFQLKPSGRGIFSARPAFRMPPKAILTFLMGHGSVQTRLGSEPGNPVIAIRSLPQTSLASLRVFLVRWQAPLG
jgi:hypothetical protein